METQPEETKSEETLFTGVVKWFNNKSGYGFIKSIDDENDIFVHHSKIIVENEQFKYLVQGEYVSFNLEYSNDENAKHKYQAINIRGISGGKLMCETRNTLRPASSTTRSTSPVKGYRSRERDEEEYRPRRTNYDENYRPRTRHTSESADNTPRVRRASETEYNDRRPVRAPYKKRYETRNTISQEEAWRVVRKNSSSSN
jgi:cold shock CspA family protein